MTVRLQRVKSASRWDRPRAVRTSGYWVIAAVVLNWMSYEVWITK